jgi:hypothetical protein
MNNGLINEIFSPLHVGLSIVASYANESPLFDLRKRKFPT